MSDWMNNPEHDYGGTADMDSFMRAWRDMTDYDLHPLCPCGERRQPLAMHGTSWGWESFHDYTCPESEEGQEVEAVRVTMSFNGAEYSEAEAIWAAGDDNLPAPERHA